MIVNAFVCIKSMKFTPVKSLHLAVIKKNIKVEKLSIWLKIGNNFAEKQVSLRPSWLQDLELDSNGFKRNTVVVE